MTTADVFHDRSACRPRPDPSLSNGRSGRKGVLYIAALALLLLPSCSSTSLLTSTSGGQPITVDGDLPEWIGTLEEVKGTPLSMALRDDSTFLYVALQTKDQNVMRQMMISGLTLWFNNLADKTRQLGIRFPVGRAAEIARSTEGRRPDTPTDRFGHFEIINEDGEVLKQPTGAVRGLMTRAAREFGSFTYELKIPLRSNGEYDYAIDIPDSGFFGMGIEIGNPRRGSGPGAAGLGGRGGFGNGRGGRPGGRGAGDGRRGAGSAGSSRAAPPLSIEFWSRVALSNSETQN